VFSPPPSRHIPYSPSDPLSYAPPYPISPSDPVTSISCYSCRADMLAVSIMMKTIKIKTLLEVLLRDASG
jgi:hypothetical protein